MKVIVVEDESGVAQNLLDLLKETDPDIKVLEVLESVKGTINWIESNEPPDLGFFDIRLGDGNSFDIFEKTEVNFPVIFTTAYDEYALQAFKVNSIDYLLKPLDKAALELAIDKYRSLFASRERYESERLAGLIREFNANLGTGYKKSFLVYVKDRIIPVNINEIAYFYLEAEQVFCKTFNGERFKVDQALDRISTQTDPSGFYRANRQVIVSRESVKNLSQHFNRKLKLHLDPCEPYEILISKTKVTDFKKWLEK